MTTENRQPDGPRSQTRIQSVSRAVEILSAVAASPGGMTAKELSEHCGLALPTTYHLLTTLWAEGMLSKGKAREFQLGPRMRTISAQIPREEQVPESLRLALREVVDVTGETAYLGVWRNNTVEIVESVEGDHAVRVMGLGDSYAASQIHTRASGKLFLAYADAETQEAVLSQLRLRPMTPKSITRRDDLLAEFAQIREQGLAYDREEFQLGVHCISAPIFLGDEIVACITVSSPTQRFEETEGQLLAALNAVIEVAEAMLAAP